MKSLRIFALVACAFPPGLAQQVGAPTADLDKVSIDELFSVQVTSVGRKAQERSKAAAAIFVLTAEDIRRSGATCIPEALEWVPGLTVLHLDGRSWVVSARGGARLYADKILVMIDGRSLYTPLFSGVVWDAIDVPMADIEQIEVVRGPGAVMWGPNAVNGVINIITKSAKATKGAQVSIAAGNTLPNSTEARWGAASDNGIAYRVWGKFDDLTPAFNSPGYFRFINKFNYEDPSVHNLDSASGRMGFRLEGQAGEKDQWMVQAEGYRTDRQDPVAVPIELPNVVRLSQGHSDYEGGDIQAKWIHTTSADSDSQLQFAFSKDDWNWPFLNAHINNLNIDYQKRIQTGERNELYWGGGFQQYWDNTLGGALSFSPAAGTFRTGDAVLRDEWQFVPGLWTASAGVRLDYNSYRKLEFQPSVRLLFTPDSKQSAWFAMSRAVRTPSRFDRDVAYAQGSVEAGPSVAAADVFGNANFRSEVENSVETGYRFQSGQRWSVDASIFWSYYTQLRLLQTTGPTVDFTGGRPAIQEDFYTGNAGTGRSYGGEIWGDIQLLEHWRLIPSYSYLNEVRWMPASTAVLQYAWDGTPAEVPHQVLLRSQHDLSRNIRVDLMARARSHDDAMNLPGVVLIDARLAWRLTRSGEVSATVQDLANRQVLESYGELATMSIPVRRTFIFRWTQRF
jgi:iron complex outermembrane receptor protein